MHAPETNRDLRGRPLIGTRAAMGALVLLLGLAALVFLVLPKIDFSSDRPPPARLPPPPSVVAAPGLVAEPETAVRPIPGEREVPPDPPENEADPVDPALVGLLASGIEHEQQGLWALALADYRSALARQPDSDAARAGLDRVKAAIAGEKFQSAMSAGLTALEQKSYQRALQAFREARSFHPDRPEVNDGIAQAREGIRLARIAALRRRASDLEKQEQWSEAAAVYGKALGIDANLAFARQGKARSERLGQAAAQLNYYLERPKLLYSDKARAQARTFSKQLSELDASGAPKLRAGIREFEKRIEVASTPLPVQLRSDNQTEVTIYHTGRLGRFESMWLDLRPGDWTVVGSRPGYKDVRLRLDVVPGASPPSVYIACKDRI